MDPIPVVIGLQEFFRCHKSPPVNHASPVTLPDLEPAEIGTVKGRYNLQFTLFTTKWQGELRPALIFLKTCLNTGLCKLKTISLS